MSYTELVRNLCKPGEDILKDLSPSKAHQLHMAVGVSGEAGELLDAIKKAAIYNKELDRDNVIEEFGDLEFYMEGLRQSLGITRGECLEANYEKLNRRYHKGNYSNDQAQERADKIQQLEEKLDNACEALTAIKASGTMEEDVIVMAQRGLDNQPQPDSVRLC